MNDTLLIEIKQYLDRTGMGPAYFGKKACGNSELVSRLEKGRSIELRTAERIRAFIAEHSREAAQ